MPKWVWLFSRMMRNLLIEFVGGLAILLLFWLALHFFS